jgi:hypothetical protein
MVCVMTESTMRALRTAMIGSAVVVVLLLLPVHAFGQPRCADLAVNSVYGLAGNPGVSRLSARAVPISPVSRDQPSSTQTATVRIAYCEVEFWYNSGKAGLADGYEEKQSQAIGIRVGLPLRADDGGIGSWNGKIHNLGNSGCMGRLPTVTPATNAGYAGAVSDGGHAASDLTNSFDCGFALSGSSRPLNMGLLRDFTAEHLLWQTRWSKQLASLYYGSPSRRTYWSGCSQGGREAHIIAQTIPEEYDGVLGGGAGLWWMQFQLVQAWPGLVIKDMLEPKGKTITPAQMEATTDRAIEACDALDGVTDGVLGDPRRCTWSAHAAVCGARGSQPGLCLDGDQADAYDQIRRGPHNSKGELIWFPFEPDSAVPINIDAFLGQEMMRWTVGDAAFSAADHVYIDRAHLDAAHDPLGITYEDMATLASQRVSDFVDGSNPTAMNWAKSTGTKFLMWTGTADRNIQSRNTIEFYRRTAAQFGVAVDSPDLQSWYRVFLYPGVAHCGGGDGPAPGNPLVGPLFEALVKWVEEAVSPVQILATTYQGATRNQTSRMPSPGPVVGTRPVCPYPQTALYNGNGDVNDARSFVCGGNLELGLSNEPLAKHKFENGTGIVGPPYGKR